MRDLAAVAAIQSASPEASQWDPKEYLDHDFHVATEEDRITGFLVTRRVAPGEYEVLNLATAPGCRRRGIARGLLDDWLKGISGDVFLEVRESNQRARMLYKSLGFQEVSVRRNYYERPQEGAIVLKFHSC